MELWCPLPLHADYAGDDDAAARDWFDENHGEEEEGVVPPRQPATTGLITLQAHIFDGADGTPNRNDVAFMEMLAALDMVPETEEGAHDDGPNAAVPMAGREVRAPAPPQTSSRSSHACMKHGPEENNLKLVACMKAAGIAAATMSSRASDRSGGPTTRQGKDLRPHGARIGKFVLECVHVALLTRGCRWIPAAGGDGGKGWSSWQMIPDVGRIPWKTTHSGGGAVMAIIPRCHMLAPPNAKRTDRVVQQCGSFIAATILAWRMAMCDDIRDDEREHMRRFIVEVLLRRPRARATPAPGPGPDRHRGRHRNNNRDDVFQLPAGHTRRGWDAWLCGEASKLTPWCLLETMRLHPQVLRTQALAGGVVSMARLTCLTRAVFTWLGQTGTRPTDEFLDSCSVSCSMDRASPTFGLVTWIAGILAGPPTPDDDNDNSAAAAWAQRKQDEASTDGTMSDDQLLMNFRPSQRPTRPRNPPVRRHWCRSSIPHDECNDDDDGGDDGAEPCRLVPEQAATVVTLVMPSPPSDPEAEDRRSTTTTTTTTAAADPRRRLVVLNPTPPPPQQQPQQPVTLAHVIRAVCPTAHGGDATAFTVPFPGHYAAGFKPATRDAAFRRALHKALENTADADAADRVCAAIHRLVFRRQLPSHTETTAEAVGGGACAVTLRFVDEGKVVVETEQ